MMVQSKAHGSMMSGWIHAPKTVAPAGPRLSMADEEMEMRKMRDFASSFRTERLKLGYTEADVAQQITIRYAFPVCEGKVSMFESANLCLNEMQEPEDFSKGMAVRHRACAGSRRRRSEETRPGCDPQQWWI